MQSDLAAAWSKVSPVFQRLKRYMAPACLFTALIIVCLRSMMVWRGAGTVYGSLWQSGDFANEGLNPFMEGPLTWVVTYGSERIVDLNLNPPAFLPLFQGFAMAEVRVGAVALLFVTVAAYFWTITRFTRDPIRLAWAATAPMFIQTLAVVQIYVVLALLGAASFAMLKERRDILAAFALGALIALRPNFALVSAALFVSGDRRAAVVSGAVAVAISLTPIAIYGPQIYAQWLGALSGDEHWRMIGDVSIAGTFHRLGLLPIGQAAAVALAIFTLFRVRTLELPERFALAATAAVLCSPLGWYHYLLVAVPALLVMRWSPALIAGLVILHISPEHFLPERGGPLPLLAPGFFGMALVYIGIAKPSFARLKSGSRLPAGAVPHSSH